MSAKKKHPFLAYLIVPEDWKPKTGILERIKEATLKRSQIEKDPKVGLIPFVVVSPDMATDLLMINIGNRQPSGFDIERYANDMKNDRWIWNGPVLKVDWNGRLFDGQKELAAQRASGKTIMYHIQTCLNPIANTVTDTGRNRTVADALHDAGFTDCFNLAAFIRNVIYLQRYQCVSGSVKKIKGAQRLDNQEVVSWAKASESNMKIVGQIMSETAIMRRKFRFFAQSQWATLWYLLYRVRGIDKEEAAYFIRHLADGDLNSKNIRDANILHLRNRLQHLDHITEKKNTSEFEDHRFRLVFYTWNRSREGKRISEKFYKDVNFADPKIEKPF